MPPFTCNICGAFNDVQQFATEPASCTCGSNVRCRALIHLLSMELFGRSLILRDFPRLKAIRGLGMTDKECYARILEDKFDYTNTYYDREPRIDFTRANAERHDTYDFVLSSDVLEHIAPPVERAFDEVHRLLNTRGFFVVTVPCRMDDTQTHEHFPDLHEYRVIPLGGSPVLVNRRRDGGLEIRDDLVFHGGDGATLEMRQFGRDALRNNLLAAGFRDQHFFLEDIPEIGIVFDSDVSQPLVARKEPFALAAGARGQLIDLWRAVEERREAERARADTLARRMEMASRSRWLRLGRRFGLGPKLDGAA